MIARLSPLLLLHAANAGRLHLITNKRAGLLDPGTGLLQLDALALPKTHNKSCSWDLLRGTAGQSSAVFYQNSSLFAVAQQVCNRTTSSGKKESSIIGTHILAFFANGAGARLLDREGSNNLTAMAAAAEGGASKALAQLHIAWDFVCNLIVTLANTTSVAAGYPRNTSFARAEVSEYDGEVRPLPAGGNETDGFEGCGHGCWKRVSGVGGLSARRDWGAWRSMENAGGERPEEATCKEDCAVYHIESWWNAYEEVGPRRIIGRGLHNLTVLSNGTEPTLLRTMSWLPPNETQRSKGYLGTFLGLGECCELRDCPPECEGHGGQLSIVSYYPGSYSPRVVLPLVGTTAATDELATRMGVAIDHFYPVGGPDSQLLMPRITVWVNGKLQSYRVEFDGYEKYNLPSLVPIAMSPVVKLDGRGEEAVAMAYTYF